MSDPDAVDLEVLLSQLTPPERAVQAGSFGGVASDYERYRPGPPDAAIDWIVPTRVHRIIDLGAGTGVSTRPLLGRADEVVAVEPDTRMRSVLARELPGIQVVTGRGESMPIPDDSTDIVLASSAWHWMDAIAAFREVGRVLVPGGTLGILLTVPDPEGSFLEQAQALLADPAPGGPSGTVAGNGGGATPYGEFSSVIMGNAYRPLMSFEVPPGVPFDQPEHEVFRWDVALNADELIGLLGTWPWIITLPEETRNRVFEHARRLLREMLGVEGEVTVDVAFRSDAWRCHLLAGA